MVGPRRTPVRAKAKMPRVLRCRSCVPVGRSPANYTHPSDGDRELPFLPLSRPNWHEVDRPHRLAGQMSPVRSSRTSGISGRSCHRLDRTCRALTTRSSKSQQSGLRALSAGVKDPKVIVLRRISINYLNWRPSPLPNANAWRAGELDLPAAAFD